MITVQPVKMQKDRIANMEEMEPIKKAIPSVNDVIVIDGPACNIALLIRSSGGRLKGC